jgi:uncharacterized protein with GYD domain
MIYITQGRFSAEAMASLLKKPEDREAAVRKLVEASGAKMLGYYMTFGEYDFLIISEGDVGLDAYGAALVVAGASGAVSDLKSTVGMTTAQAKTMFEKAGQLTAGYSPPGQG